MVWTDYRNGNADPYFAKVNTPPAAPTGLTRSIHNPTSTKNPRIDWNANIETDFHHYEVWKKKGNANWNLLATTTNTYYIDTGETGANLLPIVNGIEVSYKLKAVDLANNKSDFSNTVSFNVPGGDQEKPGASAPLTQLLPEQFTLRQNYPNPFNPVTTIQFGLPEKSQVQLTVYNIAGELVTTLANSEYPAGYHQVIFDASQLASGIYLYRMWTKPSLGEQAGAFVQTRKMMVLK